MPHDTPLITTIVAALVLAFVFGAIANRLRMPPLVGYLLAGVAVGPHSPGFVADQTMASQLAEIGVILLMFGVGLNFSLRDLLSVRAVAIPGALFRMLFATALGLALATLMDWPLMGGLVFGLALSVSSTVVTLKALQDRHLVDSDRGRIAVGWLIVEDLAMVLALVLIPAFSGALGGDAGTVGAGAVAAGQNDAFVALAEQLLHRHLELWQVLALTLVKLLAFVGFMVVVGRRIIPFILHATAHTGSRELFRLAVLAIALGVAAGAAYLFGVSLALGAFFAGMILSESELSHRAAQETLPLRDAFGVLFFVSVGMLFDPAIIVTDPLPVIATLAIVLVGKSLVGFLLLVIFRRPVAVALQISAALAQIGEFSFILAALGVSLGIMPKEGQALILAGAIVSIVLNPLAFWLAERLRPRLEQRPGRHAEPELGPIVPDHVEEIVEPHEGEAEEVLEEVAQPTRLSNHVVLIGYGRVGTVVGEELSEEGSPFVLVEDAEGRVLAARERGIEVIVGNAATRNALMLANVMGARCVVIAIPNAFEAGQAVEQCRKLNAGIRIIARAHSDEEVEYLTRLGADEVIMGEREIGLGMIDWLKGQTKAEGRREDAAPRLSDGGNLLRQARTPPPESPQDAETIALMDLEPLTEESEPHAAVPVPRPPMVEPPLVPPPLAAPTRPVAVPLPAAPAEARSADLPSPRVEPVRPVEPILPPVAPAVASLAIIAGRPPLAAADTAPVAAAVVPPSVEPSLVVEAEPIPEAASRPPVEVAEVAAEEPLSFLVREPAPSAIAEDIAAAPVTESPVFEPPAATSPWQPPVMRYSAILQPRVEPPVEIATPATPIGLAPAEPGAVAAFPAPIFAAPEPATEPEPAEPAPEAGTIAEAVFAQFAPAEAEFEPPSEPGGAPPRPGVRVVPASEIVILPPEPGAGDAAAPAPPLFRSEFWDEPDEAGAEPELFPGQRRPPGPMRDVREIEAARAAVEGGAWFEALERDLFGAQGEEEGAVPPRPSEEPQPAPQPIETPTPQEEPLPSPQPIETPHPAEEPLPPSQPIETPAPIEIPNPTAPPSYQPPLRDDREPGDESVDALGRREPRLY
jgi:monovalent cation:H+ antiporter-2, CPA2 family